MDLVKEKELCQYNRLYRQMNLALGQHLLDLCNLSYQKEQKKFVIINEQNEKVGKVDIAKFTETEFSFLMGKEEHKVLAYLDFRRFNKKGWYYSVPFDTVPSGKDSIHGVYSVPLYEEHPIPKFSLQVQSKKGHVKQRLHINQNQTNLELVDYEQGKLFRVESLKRHVKKVTYQDEETGKITIYGYSDGTISFYQNDMLERKVQESCKYTNERLMNLAFYVNESIPQAYSFLHQFEERFAFQDTSFVAAALSTCFQHYSDGRQLLCMGKEKPKVHVKGRTYPGTAIYLPGLELISK